MAEHVVDSVVMTSSTETPLDASNTAVEFQDIMRKNTVPFGLDRDLEAKAEWYFVKSDKKHIDVAKTTKRFLYLLGLTSSFRHFIEAKAEKNETLGEILEAVNKSKRLSGSSTNNSNHRGRKNEREEDQELIKEDDDSTTITEFTESPGYIHGKLRPYQIQGLNWLINLHENNLSGILADEMGLGKTLQTISFLGYLRYFQNVTGPHIVITPKSTLDNWAREFARWTPDVNVLVLQGDKEQRNELILTRLMTCDFDVVIVSYEIVIREKSYFKKFDWQYVVVDEAHRIKNEESLLSQIIRLFHSQNRLLITGTPLQNNLHELWALLNYILPDVFSESESFDSWFSNKDDEDNMVSQLHKVLKPFLLRRIKADVEKSLLPKQELNVYVKMSDMQKKWYQKILEKDIDAVNGANGKKESKTRLLNIVMQLRKCCNHPYLFEGAEPGPPYTTDEHLVYNSYKMMILDKLLKKFRAEGSRVLIFSQMSRMLDILEDYCAFREYKYCRIDGQTEHADRVNSIDEYNAPGSEKFVFLLTTRAGGLGINLTSADIVILFDSDWNPQADLQAMDRAHRIGQTKQVKVFRFITENAIEEKILERAAQKLRLDQLVIQQGRNSGGANQSNKAASKDELLNMIQFGASEMFETNGDSLNNSGSLDLDIEDILKNSEAKTQKLNQKFAKLDINALQHFSNDESVYEWNGENFKKKEPSVLTNIGHGWINPGKRERKENYSIDMYYKDVLNTGSRTTAPKSGPKPPKQLNIYDHQFYPAKLFELYELEKNYYKKLIRHKVPLKAGSPKTLPERELEQRLEQQEIDNARPLTEEEKQLKDEILATEGFSNWNRRDFQHFITSSIKHGRNAISAIVAEFDDKTEEEVRAYAQSFWTNYEEIEGYERYIGQIEAGEEKIKKIKFQQESLRRKLSQYRYPLQELVLKHPPSTSHKKTFTEDEDRFLLVQLYKFGIDSPDIYDRIKDSIRSYPLFEFDFFLQSRTIVEIGRRCQTLLGCVVKEFMKDGINPATKRKTPGSATPEPSKKKSKK